LAKKRLEEILDGISSALKDLEQEDLFTSLEDKYKVLSLACEAYLKYNGFTVISPKPRNKSIKSLDDLINLFYDLFERYHPGLEVNYGILVRDRKLARDWVNSRSLASGSSKEIAMSECAEVIKTIFEHEDEFKFNMPISFSILGLKSCGWITDKAIQIINRKKLKEEEERSEAYIRKLDEEYDAEPDGFGDLDEILKNLD
jgi:hypothetical protein